MRCPGPLDSCTPVSLRRLFCCVRAVLGCLAPVHRCACSLSCVACAVSWATRLRFIGVPVGCVVLRVRCSGPLGFSSPVCPFRPLLCLCGVLGHVAPVHRCARSVCCLTCTMAWATWLPFTGVPTRCVVLCVRCPGPLGSCSPVCPLGGLCCVCRVLGHLAPVHRCARSVGCVACAVSCATRLLFTGVSAWFVVLLVPFPGPLGSRSPVRPLGVLCCVCGAQGHFAPVHRCARSVCCVVCAVSPATWLLFTGVPVWCVVLRVRCPGPLGSCSLVCPRGGLCCVCGVLGHLAPIHRCAARWVLLRGRSSGPLGSCSPVCPFRPLPCLCGVHGHLAPVHRAHAVFCVAWAVFWATWLLFTVVPARWVVLPVLCHEPSGSCSPVCLLAGFCCLCGVLGHLAPLHRCPEAACCVACAVSWATWLLLTGVPSR